MSKCKCFMEKELPLVGHGVHTNGNGTFFAFLPWKKFFLSNLKACHQTKIIIFEDSQCRMFTFCSWYDSLSKTGGCSICYYHLLTINSLIKIQSMLKVTRWCCFSGKHVFNWMRCMEIKLLIVNGNKENNYDYHLTFTFSRFAISSRDYNNIFNYFTTMVAPFVVKF